VPSTADAGVASPDGVTVSLALADDGALAGVVAALASSDAHLRGLTKSEPTLEDVFVELVGRGFDEADADTAPVGVPA
jgi:ABC-2 type transport system ATP-binding protein